MRKKILFPILLLMICSPSFGIDYWGLRNINMNLDDEVYQDFNASWYAFGTSWDRIENPDDSFNWASIDAAIYFTQNNNGRAILVLEPESKWASNSEARAPNDLDRDTPLDEVPERGFSESLYDYAYKIVERWMKADPNLLQYLRYAGEPQYYNLDPPHWIATKDTYEQDAEDYLRCLRTVYRASHKASEDYGGTIKVSHGGFYYDDQLVREWYLFGEAHPEAQDSLIQLFRSRYERHWHQTADSWDDIERRVNRQADIPPCYWMDLMAGQSEWLDFFDVHYHWKPRYIFDELGAFERQVLDSGGTLKPWFSAETAFQLNPNGDTDYDADFHAADMVRKWIFGMAFGLKGTCTPILGMPPEKFFGLYSVSDERYKSADAYVFLRSLIEPAEAPVDISNGDIKAYRFNEENHIIDIAWRDALFDADMDTKAYIFEKPSEDAIAEVYTIYGAHYEIANPTSWQLSQTPIIIVWTDGEINSGHRKFEPADGKIYHGVGWDYKNSVPNYLEMTPETQQPLLFQTMFSIPGTRGVTVEKIIGGLAPEAMDTNKQYIEFGVHFHKTQDEPYDSIFAYTNEMDHYMDSLAIAMKAVNRPFFLRIGGEMNGPWNNYTEYTFPKAFRKLVLGLRQRGVNNFAAVWCYEPAAAADFADSTELGWKWYPGDDVVDWYGLDVFPLRDFDPEAPDTNRNDGSWSSKGKSELFLQFARERGYPVYINETTCHSENVIPDNEDPGFVEGEKIWGHWFEPFFTFLAGHPEIKAFNYINLDWTPIEKWTHWGDCRLEINTYIKEHWIAELAKDKYIHAGYDITSEQPPSFKLVSPIGGEKWPVGSEQKIMWSNASFNFLKIEFSYDNGANWKTLEENAPTLTGFYDWNVPDKVSDECIIKISNSENLSESRMSGVFSIYVPLEKELQLLAPNGGEAWNGNETRIISWQSRNIISLKIEYSLNNGRAWTVIEESYPADSGRYEWLVPFVSSERCLVSISDAREPSILDISDRNFSIYEESGVENLNNKFALYNYPDPFNESTAFCFYLQSSSEVELCIFDAGGRKLQTLINSYMPAGQNEIKYIPKDLSPGIYFYKFKSGTNVMHGKMIFIRQ